jgi:hypothetical protein
MTIAAIVCSLLICVLLGLQAWRWMDNRRSIQVWEDLTRKPQNASAIFNPSSVDTLPEPARRYFLFTIRAEAPIRTVTEIHMRGEIGLGTKRNPNYQPMRAKEILAPPDGLVWSVKAGHGVIQIAGSDGFDGETSWVRFWLMNTIPIVRAGGTSDHARAAFGRVIAEAVFWAPATLLPNRHVTWEAVNRDTARAKVTYRGLTQAVDVTVDNDGRPTMVVIPRWSDANADKSYRLQPFGGYLSDFRDVDGYMLPTRVEGGNFIGTEEYFPFYKVDVETIRFVDQK